MGAFEGLLREVAGSVKAMAALQEDILERVRGVEKDVSNMKADIAKFKEAQKWDHKERRKVDGRLETGDHTFEKLAVQIQQAEKATEAAQKEVSRVGVEVMRSNKKIETIEKKLSISSNRRFAIVKMAIGAALTAALAVFTAWATAKFSAPQANAQVEKKETGGR